MATLHMPLTLTVHLRIAFLCMILAAMVPPGRAQEVESGYGPLPVFEFHSGFWVNLHHTLYSLARERKASGTEKMLLETALLRA